MVSIQNKKILFVSLVLALLFASIAFVESASEERIVLKNSIQKKSPPEKSSISLLKTAQAKLKQKNISINDSLLSPVQPASSPPIETECFWFDADTDKDIDQSDFGRFTACLTGQGSPISVESCRRFDSDSDNDVDSSDSAVFQTCLSGPQTLYPNFNPQIYYSTILLKNLEESILGADVSEPFALSQSQIISINNFIESTKSPSSKNNLAVISKKLYYPVQNNLFTFNPSADIVQSGDSTLYYLSISDGNKFLLLEKSNSWEPCAVANTNNPFEIFKDVNCIFETTVSEGNPPFLIENQEAIQQINSYLSAKKTEGVITDYVLHALDDDPNELVVLTIPSPDFPELSFAVSMHDADKFAPEPNMTLNKDLFNELINDDVFLFLGENYQYVSDFKTPLSALKSISENSNYKEKTARAIEIISSTELTDYGVCGDGYCDSDETCIEDCGARVFVTSQIYDGNLGGLAGADEKCRQAAKTANLGGIWKAYIGTEILPAESRIYPSPLPYKKLDGTLIANNYNDLTDSSIESQINIDEFNESVPAPEYSNFIFAWTGSAGSDGKIADCNDWTNNNLVFSNGNWILPSSWNNYGGAGIINWESERQAQWSSAVSSGCHVKNKLYCIEQPASEPSRILQASANPNPSPIPIPQGMNTDEYYRLVQGTVPFRNGIFFFQGPMLGLNKIEQTQILSTKNTLMRFKKFGYTFKSLSAGPYPNVKAIEKFIEYVKNPEYQIIYSDVHASSGTPQLIECWKSDDAVFMQGPDFNAAMARVQQLRNDPRYANYQIAINSVCKYLDVHTGKIKTEGYGITVSPIWLYRMDANGQNRKSIVFQATCFGGVSHLVPNSAVNSWISVPDRITKLAYSAGVKDVLLFTDYFLTERSFPMEDFPYISSGLLRTPSLIFNKVGTKYASSKAYYDGETTLTVGNTIILDGSIDTNNPCLTKRSFSSASIFTDYIFCQMIHHGGTGPQPEVAPRVSSVSGPGFSKKTEPYEGCNKYGYQVKYTNMSNEIEINFNTPILPEPNSVEVDVTGCVADFEKNPDVLLNYYESAYPKYSIDSLKALSEFKQVYNLPINPDNLYDINWSTAQTNAYSANYKNKLNIKLNWWPSRRYEMCLPQSFEGEAIYPDYTKINFPEHDHSFLESGGRNQNRLVESDATSDSGWKDDTIEPPWTSGDPDIWQDDWSSDRFVKITLKGNLIRSWPAGIKFNGQNADVSRFNMLQSGYNYYGVYNPSTKNFDLKWEYYNGNDAPGKDFQIWFPCQKPVVTYNIQQIYCESNEDCPPDNYCLVDKHICVG